MQGALQAAAQDTQFGKCVAVCVEGGPVTRVEHRMMEGIVKNVHVYGKETSVEVKFFTFQELKEALAASAPSGAQLLEGSVENPLALVISSA